MGSETQQVGEFQVTVVHQQHTQGQKYFIYFLRFLKGLNVLTLLTTIAAYCLTMKTGIEAKNLSDLEKSFIVMSQIGFTLMSIMCVIGEFEPQWFIRYVFLLHYWPGRGGTVAWLGIQTLYSTAQMVEAVKAEGSDADTDALSIIGQVCGWMMVSVGGIYILMGLMCIRACTGVDQDNELQVSLVGATAVTTAPEGGGKINVVAPPSAGKSLPQDVVLISNMALALGLKPDAARKKFAGKDGVKAAEKLRIGGAKGAAELAAAKAEAEAAKKVAMQASEAANAAISSAASLTVPESPRSPQNDADELERIYYGNKNDDI